MDEIPSVTPSPLAPHPHKEFFIIGSIFTVLMLLVATGIMYFQNNSAPVAQQESEKNSLMASTTLTDLKGNISRYTKDTLRVYLDQGNGPEIVKWADPASLQPIDSNCWKISKDSSHVFWGTNENDGRFSALYKYADPKTFTLVYDENGVCTDYSKDSIYVFYGDYRLPTSTDPASFTATGGYGRDKNSIYFRDALQDVDTDSFQFILNGNGGGRSLYSKDKNRVYIAGQSSVLDVIQGADPETFTASYPSDCFRIIEEGPNNCKDITYTAQDKNHKYIAGEIVE